MKKSLSFLLLVMMFCVYTYAEQPKCEFRATWLATVSNIDWPKTRATSTSNRTKQQKELTDILDKLHAGNMNAVCMQVRSLCDAMYQSSYEPWSAALTGTRGQDPGYDPLAFAIEEAHKRGMELHVWVNPFRASTGSLSSTDMLWQNAGGWLIKYNNGSFKGYIIDPGHPEARAYVVKVLMEIVTNYDVDGIVMDDYFYAYGGTTDEDIKAQNLYFDPTNVVDMNNDGNKLDDWRRSNVDDVVKTLYERIQSVKPWVRFGMGPGGIWSIDKGAANAYGINLPSGIVGGDPYATLYCNTVEWIKQGWVDYVNPQIYWSTQVAAQDYDVLCKWWSKDVCEHFSNQLPDGKKVYHFPSPAAYKVYNGAKGYEDGVEEMKREIDANRRNLSSGYTGAVYYNTTSYLNMYAELAQSHYIYPALPPPMDWKVNETLEAPADLILTGNTMTWQHPVAERFTVYAYPKGTDPVKALANPAYLEGIVWGNTINLSHLGDLSNITIAVATFDRYGVEHGVAYHNLGEVIDDPDDNPDITWVLNGGVLPEVEVPTNQQLWEMFKADFDTFYAAIYPSYVVQDYPINAVLEMTWPKWSEEPLALEFMNEHPDWHWLADYIQSVYGEISDVRTWRFNLYAFFNATDQVYYVDGTHISYANCGDFTIAGKPEAWGSYYQAAKGMVTLPESVSAAYTLPTNIIHPDGYAFLGWWDNATFVGEQMYSIPAYWKGVLYANWQNTTHLENVLDVTLPIEIYDIMGRFLGTDIEHLQGDIFIIKQGNNVFKLIK